MTTPLPTERRRVIRLLLRGLPASTAGQLSIEGRSVLVSGPAQKNGWPGRTLLPGDVDGVIWADDEEVEPTLRALSANSCVVDVSIEP